jgi:ATP-dependent Zn protease
LLEEEDNSDVGDDDHNVSKNNINDKKIEEELKKANVNENYDKNNNKNITNCNKNSLKINYVSSLKKSTNADDFFPNLENCEHNKVLFIFLSIYLFQIIKIISFLLLEQHLQVQIF